MRAENESPRTRPGNRSADLLQSDLYRLAEAMPQLVWTAAPDGQVNYFNHHWIEYTGLTAEAMLLPGEKGVVHPDERAESISRWEDALASREPYQMEYRLRRESDGSYRWFLSRAVPEFDERGELRGWIGTATDIDEQRRARDDLTFLVRAGNLLSALSDVPTACKQLADVAVDGFADWCFVTLLEEDGVFSTVAIAHRDQARVRYVEQFRDLYPPDPNGTLARVVADNTPLLIEHVLPEHIHRSARDATHLSLLKTLTIHSVIVVPLSTAQGTRFGALTLVSAESGRSFSQRDLEVADAVATRAAGVIERAKLFDREKQTSQRLRFVSKASQLLLHSSDAKTTFSEVAGIIASEMADVCAIALIDDGGLRVETIVCADPALAEFARRSRGTRPMHPEAERRMIARLQRNEPVLRPQLDLQAVVMTAWPFLAGEIRGIGLSSAIIVPLQTRGKTYGGIFSYYTRSGRTYGEDDLPVFVEIAQRVALTIDNANALERERRIATTLQKASLPSLIPRPSGLRFDAVYAAAGDEGEVGGDWYDALELDDGSVVVSVGDVTGQGLEAAVIMSKVRHVLAAVPLHELDPARILDAADWVLRKRFPDAVVTAFLGVISPDRRTLRFASAGHPPPYLRRGNAVHVLQSQSHALPLGLRTLVAPQTSESVEMEDGDLLLLYTDGLTEWNRNILSGEKRLGEVMRNDAVLHTARPATLVKAACMDGPLRDDVAILSVAFGEGPAWSFYSEDARAAEHARDELVAHLRGRNADPALLASAELVFGELIGNAVRHAPGPIEIQLEWNERGPAIHLIDCGSPFEVNCELPEDDFSESGRGLYIIGRVSNAVTVRHIPGYGNYIRVELGVPAAHRANF